MTLKKFRGVVASLLALILASASAAGGITPNDPAFSPTGAQAQAGFPAAWNATLCDKSIITAVVGSGVTEVADLTGQLVPGWNVGGGSNTAGYNDYGTAVAGVVGGLFGNGIGVAGSCPNGRIMPIRVPLSDGVRPPDWIGKAIAKASLYGARIIVVDYHVTHDDQFGSILKSANLAVREGKVVIFPAGNTANGPPEMASATVPGVIWVTGTDPKFNQGPWVDVRAPTAMPVLTRNGQVLPADGTMYAGGLVAGAVGLMLSIKPDLRPDRIEAILKGINSGRLDAYAALLNPEVGYQPKMAALNVSKSGDGQGTVTTDPAGIVCDRGCSKSSKSFEQGAVTLKAQPATGSLFAGWTGGGCGYARTCTLDLRSDIDVVAKFDKQKVGLKVFVRGPGKVTSSTKGIDCAKACSTVVPYGSRLTLTARRQRICSSRDAKRCTLSNFIGWQGDCFGKSLRCKLKTDGPRTVIAVFGPQGQKAKKRRGSS